VHQTGVEYHGREQAEPLVLVDNQVGVACSTFQQSLGGRPNQRIDIEGLESSVHPNGHNHHDGAQGHYRIGKHWAIGQALVAGVVVIPPRQVGLVLVPAPGGVLGPFEIGTNIGKMSVEAVYPPGLLIPVFFPALVLCKPKVLDASFQRGREVDVAVFVGSEGFHELRHGVLCLVAVVVGRRSDRGRGNGIFSGRRSASCYFWLAGRFLLVGIIIIVCR